MEEGEGVRQITYMPDPWTQTMVWGLTMGMGAGCGKGGKRGKIGTTIIV